LETDGSIHLSYVTDALNAPMSALTPNADICRMDGTQRSNGIASSL
jgi:hypothetical protein